MFNLDEEKIEYALGNKELCFWQGKKAENIVFCILYVRRAAFICLIYLTVQIIQWHWMYILLFPYGRL